MDTAERFRTAVEEHDLTALDELFTEDVRFHSPVKYAPFDGLPAVKGLFGVLLRTFEDFRYVGRLDGTAETGAGGGRVPSAALFFRAAVNGREIHGVDLLQFDGAGRIEEFTVMVRPQSAVHALGEAVTAALVAEGIVPDPAARG
ncbi:nuclear transport factor 2 family protein [Streptomyces sp. NPDC001380]|uniref:nuclear transport factor 2 family protein n=1 Tax=Streptomyces sp. NPDC001380 TaxID=3364566 RepID=UPI00369F351B